jgi:hypothetical protein
MITAKTKEEALLQMRLVWLAITLTIPLYIYAGTITSFAWLNFPKAETIFYILGVLYLISFIGFRMRRYPRALEAAQEHSDNMQAVRRWSTVWMILISNGEAEAVIGVCLQMKNGRLTPALPFYVLAFLLTLSLWPRPIWSSEAEAPKS